MLVLLSNKIQIRECTYTCIIFTKINNHCDTIIIAKCLDERNDWTKTNISLTMVKYIQGSVKGKDA